MIVFNCLPRGELESFCGLSYGLQTAGSAWVLLNYAEYSQTRATDITNPGPWRPNPNKQKGGRKARPVTP